MTIYSRAFFKVILNSCFALFVALVAAVLADSPDLTRGDKPKGPGRITLGPTGMQGWIHHSWEGPPENRRTGGSRQILVEKVETGSPADGIVKPGDVILGADGTGAEPGPFTSDARKSLAYAIADAEARDPALLKLRAWREGHITTKTLELQTMGAYAPTAPYNCPKSRKILEQGLDFLYAHEDSGFQNFGLLALLSSDDPKHLARAREEAHALIPPPAMMKDMLAGVRPTGGGKHAWGRGYALVTLAEYYLATGDREVLPAVEARAVEFARNHSMFGTCGHLFANKKEDGSDNGPMGGHYGVINNTGLMGLLGLTLARECGIDNPYIQPGIDRAARFYAHYAVGSKIPYGEHHSWRPDGFSSNGKPATAALALAHLPKWVEACRYYSKWCTAATISRESGHTGPYFEYIWAPLGAAVGGEAAAASHFRRISWHLDLMRHWDGSFSYDVMRYPNTVDDQYGPFTATSDLLLTYALPRRALYITGAKEYERNGLSEKDVKEAEFASDYTPLDRTTEQLLLDIGDWCPVTSVKAAAELGRRPEGKNYVEQLIAMAKDTTQPRDLRAGACDALSQIDDMRGLPVLVALLTDKENYVRRTAAQSLRFMTGREDYVEDILKAAVKMARPLRPFDEEDPMHLDVMNVSMLLFYSGRAAGPRGILGKSIDGVDRDLLYEAVKAIAYTPNGRGRSCLDNVYRQFSAEDLFAVAGAVVDSVGNQAPADKMFSSGVRTEGLQLLERNDIAEGIPLSLQVHDLAPKLAMEILGKYGSACLEVTPDPKVVALLENQVGGPPPVQNGLYADHAKAALAKINGGAPPRELTPLKRIVSVGADEDTITLTEPTRTTTLRAEGHDHASGDLAYTWRKVHGASDLTFTPNGTGESATTQVTFDTPGLHRFEVTLSDSRGLTEVSKQVLVTVYNAQGELPDNTPPAVEPQALSTQQNTPLPMTLRGNDPEGHDLAFRVLAPPRHGTLSGSGADQVYTPDTLYMGRDSFTFEAMDSEGETATAKVDITVKSAPRDVRVYEPFAYDGEDNKEPVELAGKGGTADVGFDGVWEAPHWSKVHQNARSVGALAVRGGILYPAGKSACIRTISPAALADKGLLEDGATLWMSFALGLQENANATNSDFHIALATDPLGFDRIREDGGYGVGIVVPRGARMRAASFSHDKDPRDSGYDRYANLGTGKPYLLVVKFTWGDTPTAYDTIELYIPGDALTNLDEPNSIHKVVVDQTAFDTLTFSFKNKLILDEIRMGPDLISVVDVVNTEDK